jgi:hypothetical protein
MVLGRPKIIMECLDMNKCMVKDQSGQTTVEYLLLIVVVSTIVFAVFNSQYFKDIFGESGRLGAQMIQKVEWNYRYASPGKAPFTPASINPVNGRHPTYFNPQRRESRFFGPRDKYP